MLDDRGAVEDEGLEGHLVRPGRVDRLIPGPWLLVQRVGATLASARSRPQGHLKVPFACAAVFPVGPGEAALAPVVSSRRLRRVSEGPEAL